MERVEEYQYYPKEFKDQFKDHLYNLKEFKDQFMDHLVEHLHRLKDLLDRQVNKALRGRQPGGQAQHRR